MYNNEAKQKETTMHYYFNIEDFLKDNNIEDANIIEKAKTHDSPFSISELFQNLFEKDIKDTLIILKILDLDSEKLSNLSYIIEKLNQNQILDKEILNKVLEFPHFEKLSIACIRLSHFKLLTAETLKSIMTEEIDNKVLELTKPFPITQTYLYFTHHYGSSIKWSLGCCLGLGTTYYILAQFKLLGMSALHAHPLLGAALITAVILIIFLLSKACSQFIPQKSPSL